MFDRKFGDLPLGQPAGGTASRAFSPFAVGPEHQDAHNKDAGSQDAAGEIGLEEAGDRHHGCQHQEQPGNPRVERTTVRPLRVRSGATKHEQAERAAREEDPVDKEKS